MKYPECPVCVKLAVKMYLLWTSSVEQMYQLTFTFLSHQEELKNITRKWATTPFCPWLQQFVSHNKTNLLENPGSSHENAVFPYLLGHDVVYHEISHPAATILLSVCATWNFQSSIYNTSGENYILLLCCKIRTLFKKQLCWQINQWDCQ